MKEKLEGKVDANQQLTNYGMRTFLVKITVNIPYPKVFTYRTEATSIGTGINRAISQARQFDLKGKKIKEIIIKATSL